MFIPTKRGGLVFVIVFTCLFLVEISTRRAFHDESYYLTHRWPIPAGLSLSAALVQMCLKPKMKPASEGQKQWYLSMSSEMDGEQRKEGSAFTFLQFFREQDLFFLIPVRYWPWILCGLAGILYCFPMSGFPL